MRVRDTGSGESWSFGRRPARWVREPTRFVGREFELDWLERALKRAARGQPCVRLISGDAGIGKTRLVRELASSAQRAGFRVCYGRGHENFRVSYLPFEALLGELQTGAGEDDRVRAATNALERLLARDPGRESEDDELGSHRADADRLRTFHDVARGSFRHAQSGAVLLILEDLEWFDPTSIELLSHLAFLAADESVSEPLPLLLVCTFREIEAPAPLLRFLTGFQREEICESIVLGGFDEEELASLMRSLGIADPSSQLVARLGSVTDGNPLFVEELLHHLRREGALVERAGRWETTLDPAELSLPRHLAELVPARTKELSEECRSALTTASFMGQRFDIDGLAAVMESDPASLEPLIEEATRASVVTPVGDELAFAHSLTRRAFYGLPGPAQRRRIHQRVARWLEQGDRSEGSRHAQPLADHWIQGMAPGGEERAIELAIAAGDEAFGVFDWALAGHYYDAAEKASAAHKILSPERHADLCYRAGVVAYRDMDADSAQRLYERAIELFESCGATTGRARAQLGRARTLLTLRSVPYGTLIDVEPLETALRDLADTEPALRGFIGATLADAYGIAKQHDKAIRLGQDALELGVQTSDPTLRAYARVALGNCHTQRVALEEARDAFAAALVDARASGEAWIEGWALQRLPLTLAWLGELDQAEHSVRAAAENAGRINDWADHSLALGGQTAVACARGDFEEAEATARATAHLVRRTGYPWGGAIGLTALAGARALQGLFVEAGDALSILAEPGQVFQEPGHEMEFLVAVARLRVRALSSDVDAECLEEANNMLKLVQLTGTEIGTLAALCAFVEIAQESGDAALAEKSSEHLEAAAERGAVFTAGCEYLIPRVMGVAAALSGRPSEAEVHLRRAVSIAERAGALPELARSCVELADVIAGPEGSAHAQQTGDLMSRANRILAAKRLVGLEKRAASVAQRIGAELSAFRPEPALDGGGGLDATDHEILRAVARGRRDAEIGLRLLLRTATVERRRDAIFERIGVEGRTGATAYALAHEDGAASRTFLPTTTRDGVRRRIILVSDIVQSTQLIESLGDARAQQKLREHNRLIRARARAHGGEEIQHTGDGFILAFDNADAAVHCALSIQDELLRAGDGGAGADLAVRIGIHAGRAATEEGRLFGIAIHATFRICSSAQGGEILVTQEIMDECQDPRAEFMDVGPVALRGLAKPRNLFRVSRL